MTSLSRQVGPKRRGPNGRCHFQNKRHRQLVYRQRNLRLHTTPMSAIHHRQIRRRQTQRLQLQIPLPRFICSQCLHMSLEKRFQLAVPTNFTNRENTHACQGLQMQRRSVRSKVEICLLPAFADSKRGKFFYPFVKN